MTAARWLIAAWIATIGFLANEALGWASSVSAPTIAGSSSSPITAGAVFSFGGRRRVDEAPRRRQVALSATCRVCFQSYDPSSNGSLSCCYHPGSLRGESPRKSDWQDDNYDEDGRHQPGGGESDDDDGGTATTTTTATTSSIDNSKLVYTYTCCGAPEGADGCTRDRCKSFDDP